MLSVRRHPVVDRRPPLSGKQPTPSTTRKERRAAERRDRFEAARDERRTRAGTGGGGGSSFINTRTMTIAGVLIGVLIVAVVAIGQLGNRATGRLVDPGFSYPAALQDGSNLGQADAPVLLEVFEDYQCPVCGRYSLDVEPAIVNKYVASGQVRIVHHDIDLLGGGGDESRIPALGAYCADQQGLYWSYAHWIYNNQEGENQGGFRRERVTQIAVAAGVDEAAFNACMDSPEAAADVTQTTDMASGLGINSTPTLRINGGDLIRSLLTATQLSDLIDAELAKVGGTPGSASPTTAP
jgi:protein-disulfide isomerase